MRQRDFTRRTFLWGAGAGAAGLAGRRAAWAAKAARGDRPNVLVIYTDQQSATMMSCTGNKWVKTPAMDALAAEGTRFEKTYASNPVCLPTRFSWMTGLYPSAVGVRHNGSRPTDRVKDMPKRAMGQLFRAAGYETAYGGKVHLPRGMDIPGCGFRMLTGNQRDGLDDACETFLAQKHDKPFLLVASFINPHDICYMAIRDYKPKTSLARHTPKPLDEAMKPPAGLSEEEFYAKLCPPLPANHEPPRGEPQAIVDLLKLRPFRMNARKNYTPRRWRLHRWAYCRLTEKVDGQVGRVLAALKKAGLDRKTIVIFTSDHGDMDSAHKMEHKTLFYEEAARVPMIVRCPGRVKAGAVDQTHLVSSGVDLLPTICDYAGIQPPADLPGRSIRPLAEGKAPADWRKDLLVEDEIGTMVTDGRWKYSLFDRGARREMLVDLQTDPGEMTNLAGESKHAAVLADMRKRLRAQFKKVGVKVDVPGELAGAKV